MTHRTPDEIRRMVQTKGIFPSLDQTHPGFIVDDDRLAFLWGEARTALHQAHSLADDLVRYLNA